jgi:tetratricopeptide (TPR) repeat protein
MILTYLKITFVALCFCCTTALWASEEDIIIGQPDDYEALLKPKLLTFNMDEVSVSDFDSSISDNATVFSDEIVYIAEDGTSYEVYHRAYLALTAGNLRYLAEDTYGFRPEREKLYVVLAETINPDGTRIPVSKEGIMHQTPQRDAELAIYSGLEELLLVFPGVEVGSIVHSIIVKETQSQRIPGEYTDYWNWSGYWQTKCKRVLIDMPASMAGRLQAVTLGAPTPEIIKTNLSGDRVEWRMETEEYPIWPSEKYGAPLSQVGPLTYVTSLPDWDYFSKWYGQLLDERSNLPDELLALSKDWVGDADSPTEIINRLYRKVAREVRYTSIDFGYSGLQPQAAEVIWTNKYGDCKDKSNFLRLLLKAHGLDAYLSLINTEHAGRIDVRAPDFRHFNHAIVTVVMPDGSLIFCDPTIEYGWPNLIASSLANRPALIIDPEQQIGRWVQTPASNEDSISYNFDFSLSTSGELSGWLEFKASNSYATIFQSRFDSSDELSLRREVERYARYFYPQAEMIDYELTNPSEFEKEFKYRAYISTTLPRASGDRSIQLGWPEVAWLLPDVGTERSVKREAYLAPDCIEIKLQVALSDVHQAQAFPRQYRVKAPPYTAGGAWESDGNQVIGHFRYQLDNPAITPLNFPTLFQAVDSSAVWINEAVDINRVSVTSATKNTIQEAHELIDMELMPTGRGQLALVDRLYPAGKHDKLRLQALERVKQWFPKDVTTQFEAEVRIGWLYWDQGEEQRAIDLMQNLIRDSGHEVSRANLNWANYLLASCYKDIEEPEKALDILKELAWNEANSGFRRAWAYADIAQIIRQDQSEEAFINYRSAFDLDSGDQLQFLKLMTWHAMDQGLTQLYSEFLRDRLEKYPDLSESMLDTLSQQLSFWIEDGNSGHLLSAMFTALKSIPESDELIFSRANFEPFNAYIESQRDYLKVQQQMKSFLATADLPFWNANEFEGDALSLESLEASIQSAIDESKPDEATRLALVRIIEFEPGPNFAAWLWELALYADWREKSAGALDDGLLDTILGLGVVLPEASDESINLHFLRAFYYKRRDQLEAEYAIYRDLIERDLPEAWQNSLTRRAGLNRENVGDYESALELYESTFKYVAENDQMTDQLLRGIYIHLENDAVEEAIRWIQRAISLIDETAVSNSSGLQLIEWNRQFEAGNLLDFWAAQKEWWPVWCRLADGMGIEPMRHPQHEVPVVDDWEALGRKLGHAFNKKNEAEIAMVLRTAINATRWRTRGGSEVQYILRLMPSYLEAQSTEFHDLLIAIHESLPASLEAWKVSSLLQYVQTLADRNEYKKSIRAIEAFLEQGTQEISESKILVRIGALHAMAINDDLSVWIERLEHQRQDSESDDYIYAVNILSQLYNKTDQVEKETEVIETFFSKFPDHESDVGHFLETRLSELKVAQNNAGVLTTLVRQWLTDEAPVWLRQMPPTQVRDYAPARIISMLKQGTVPGDDYFEQIDFLMHCVLDDRLTYEVKEDALILALGWMQNTIDSEASLMPLLNSFCYNEQYSLEVRLSAIWSLYTYSIYVHDAAVVSQLVEDDYFNQFADRFKMTSKDGLSFATLDPNQPEDLNRFIDDIIAKGEVHQLTAWLLSSAVEQLIVLGECDRALDQLKTISQSALGKDPDMNWRSQRLDLTRKIRAVEKLEPLHVLLGQYLGATIESSEVEAARPELRPANTYGQRWFYGAETLMGYLKYQWLYKCYDRSSLLFWKEFIRVVSDGSDHSEQELKLLQDVVPLLVEQVVDDATALELLNCIYHSIDLDAAASREFFFKTCELLKHQGDFAECRELIKACRLNVQTRIGETLDIEKLASEIKHPWFKNYAVEAVIVYYLSRNDLVSLKRYLEKLPNEVIFDHDMLHLMLISLDRAGLDLELELLVEDADLVLRKRVAKALSFADGANLSSLFEMVQIMPNEDYFSDEWVSAMRSSLRHVRLLEFEMLLAFYHEDWTAVVRWSSEVVDQLPKYYDNYYYLGVAQYHLGKLEEARVALSLFAFHCRDSYFLPEVEALLEKCVVR